MSRTERSIGQHPAGQVFTTADAASESCFPAMVSPSSDSRRRLAKDAEQAPPQRCVDMFLETVGYELGDKAGLTAVVWGDLAPQPLVDELRRRSASLLARAQQAASVRLDVITGARLLKPRRAPAASIPVKLVGTPRRGVSAAHSGSGCAPRYRRPDPKAFERDGDRRRVSRVERVTTRRERV